jgi:hypothetical protein
MMLVPGINGAIERVRRESYKESPDILDEALSRQITFTGLQAVSIDDIEDITWRETCATSGDGSLRRRKNM